MGRYLDRLRDEAATITEGINLLVDRAADDGRDVTPDEARQVERDEGRLSELATAIEHYAGIEETTARVAAVRSTATGPRQTTTGPPTPAAYDVTAEFPTAGHYAATLHRAWVDHDPEAVAAIERATAHQTTADNPGLIPRPIVGPLINTLSGVRRFIASVTVRPAPAQKFDRPRVTQHVAVDKQAAEKDLTASQKLLIDPVGVSLETYAGHLNISKQDIRWTQPGILQVVFDDFTRIYGRRTDQEACTEFPATPGMGTADLAGMTDADLDAWLREAVNTVAGADDAELNTLWTSPDAWAAIGGIRSLNGSTSYNLPIGGGGDVSGLTPVMDRNFPAQTLIAGDSSLVEHLGGPRGIHVRRRTERARAARGVRRIRGPRGVKPGRVRRRHRHPPGPFRREVRRQVRRQVRPAGHVETNAGAGTGVREDPHHRAV